LLLVNLAAVKVKTVDPARASFPGDPLMVPWLPAWMGSSDKIRPGGRVVNESGDV